MATLSLSFEVVRQAFKEECDKLWIESSVTCQDDLSNVFWVVEELVSLLSSELPTDMPQLESIARRRLLEQSFISECGDSVADSHPQLTLAHKTKLVARTIARLQSA